MDDLDFLSIDSDHDANATLTVLLPDSTVKHIYNVSPFRVLESCPLLYHAFEHAGTRCVRQANVEATSMSAVVSFLRYLYTGNYLTAEQMDVPCSLLLHAEVYKMAEDFDVPELQVAAYLHFTRETEYACCMPTPAQGLSETIAFTYNHLAGQQSRQQHSLVNSLLHYCVQTFKYHGLGQNHDFRKVVFDTPQFHQDLCKTSMERDFEDDGASEIMHLPVCRPIPHSAEKVHKRALGDFMYEMLCDAEESRPSPGKDSDTEDTFTKRRRSNVEGNFMLVHRPKAAGEKPTLESESSSASSSDDEDFIVVHRPKPHIQTTPAPAEVVEDAPSSPELVSVPSSGVAPNLDTQTPALEDDWESVSADGNF